MSSKDVKRMKEEEFEKCMEEALEDLEDLDQPNRPTATSELSSTKHVTFDESKNEENAAQSKEKNRTDSESEDMLCNSETKDPLYDPEADDEDEKWVKNERAKHYPAEAVPGGKHLETPHSDAILSCPACMTIVCIDCQRLNQFS